MNAGYLQVLLGTNPPLRDFPPEDFLRFLPFRLQSVLTWHSQI